MYFFNEHIFNVYFHCKYLKLSVHDVVVAVVSPARVSAQLQQGADRPKCGANAAPPMCRSRLRASCT